MRLLRLLSHGLTVLLGLTYVVLSVAFSEVASGLWAVFALIAALLVIVNLAGAEGRDARGR